jgi:predicted transcriptional regulator
MADIHLPTWGEIEAACDAAGLTVAAMCRRADIDQAAFSRWKGGKGTPSLRTIQKMVDAIKREEAM